VSKIFGWVVKNPLVSFVVGVVAIGTVALGVVALVSSGDSGSSSSSSTDAPSDSVVDSTLPGDSVAPSDSGSVPVAGEAVVDVVVPAGIKLLGSTSVVDDANWVTTITGGSGSVGGFDLSSVDFSGSLETVDGVTSGSVTVVLSNHPQVVPTWKNDATLVLTYSVAKKALVGEVTYSLSRGQGKIDLSGALNDDGSYELVAKGLVPFAGQTIALSGSYSAPKNGAVDVKAMWRITGSGAAGVIDKNTPTGVTTIEMTERVPGVTGTTTVVLGDTTPVVANARVLILDEKAWRVRILNASTKSWAPKVFPVLTVATKDLTGVIESKNNAVTWDVATTAVLTSSKLTMNGTFTYSAAKTWNVAISNGGGQVLGLSQPMSKPSIQGSIVIDNGVIDGKVTVTTNDLKMISLPEGWDPLTRLTIKFSNASGAIVKQTNVAAVISRKNSRILLDGDVQGEGAYALTVAGVLRMGATPIPLVGRYESVGYVKNGVARTVPYYKFSGSISDAEGGKVPLSSGFGLGGGSIGSDSESSIQTAGVRTLQQTSGIRQPMAASSAMGGTVDMAFDDFSTFKKYADIQYSDEDNWTATLTVQVGDTWDVPGFPGLSISAESMTGTVQSTDGDLTWNVSINNTTWSNSTTGVDINAQFTLGDTCPLEDNCSDAEGIYLGMLNGTMDLPDGLPSLAINGALNTDGSWGRIEGVAPDADFENFSITTPTLTVWKGEREDSFDPNMEMPDLSAANDGLNFEFCGDFEIHIPGIPTTGTGGCVEWTPDGFVISQVAVGGSVDGGSSDGGVELDSSQLTGWAWTNLTSLPSVNLYDTVLQLKPELNSLTASFTLPGYLMDKVGLDDSLSNVKATGWFDDSDFSLDAELDVNMSNGGFSLNTITFHIGKEGNSFSLSIGAEALVKVSGNKFPMGVYIGFSAGGGTSEFVIEMDVSGTQSAMPTGGFDAASLVPTGSFEPDDTSAIDGSFDNRQGKGNIPHGDFEDATDSENMLPNPDFESGTGTSILTNGDFEDGNSGNFLSNGDIEDLDFTYNGDFEEGSATGWATSSGYTTTVLSNETAPTEDEGITAVTVKNTRTTGGPYLNTGLYQSISWAPQGGASYVLSAWVKSPDTTTGRISLGVQQTGTGSGCLTQPTLAQYQIFNVTTDWQQVSFSVTGSLCRSSFNIILDPLDANDSVEIDAVTFTASIAGNGTTPNLLPPGNMEDLDVLLNGDFETGSASSWTTSSGFTTTVLPNEASTAEPLGTTAVKVYNTKTSGGPYNDVGLYQNLSWAPIAGANYTLSAWVKSPDTTTGRIGLWIDQKGTASGCPSQTTVSQYQVFNVTTSWTQVSYTVTGSSCKTSFTVTLDPLDYGDTVEIDTVTFSPGTTSTVTSINALPNVLKPTTLSGVASGSPNVRVSPSTAHSGNGVLSATGSSTNWDMYWSTDESPTQFTTYTFSGWVKCSTCSSVAGNVYMDTAGGTTDSVSQAITINQTWQQFSVSLYMANSGHTDTRPGFKDIATTNTEILFDDMSLTVNSLSTVPNVDKPTVLSGVPAPTVSFDPNAAHSGSGVLRAMGTSTNWDMYWSTLESPAQYSTYTFVGWAKCRSCSTMAGNIYLDSTGGTTDSAQAPITLTQTWQKFSVSLYMAHSGHTDIRPGFKDIATTYSEVLFDDMSVQLVPWAPNPATSNALVEYVPTDGTNVHDGLGSLIYEARANSTSVYFDTAAPTQYATYTGSIWVKAPVNTNATLKITAKGGTEEVASVNFTATTSWQQISKNLTVNNASHTALRIEVLITSNATTSAPQTIYLDDGSIVGAPVEIFPDSDSTWSGVGYTNFESAPPISNSAGVSYVSDYGNTGKSLRTDGNADYWYFNSDSWGAVKGDFDASVDVYMPNNNSTREIANVGFWITGTGTSAIGYGYRLDTGGSNGFITFNGNNRAWVSGNSNGSNVPRGVWMRVRLTAVGDDVTGSITRLDTGAVLGTQTLTMPAGNRSGVFGQALDAYGSGTTTYGQRWDNFQLYSGSTAMHLYEDSSKAHGGSGYMQLRATSGSAYASRDTTAAPSQGNTYVGSAWVKSAGSNISGKLTVSVNGTSDTATTSFTANGTWQMVTVNLPVNGSAGTSMEMQIENATAGQSLWVDDAAIQLVGLTQPTPWGIVPGSGGTVATAAYADSTIAHGGDNYLQFSASGSAGSISYPSTFTPVVGDNYTASVWVKSANGSNMSGQLGISLEGGTTEQRWVSFTANGTWQQVWVTIPVTKTNNTTIKTLVKSSTLGASMLIDDADTRQMTPWLIVEPSGTTSAQLLIEDRSSAADGSGFERLITTGTNAGVYTSQPTTVQAGATWTMKANVRSANGGDVNGRLLLTASGGSSSSSETVTQNFTANGDWQVVELTFTATNANTTIRSEVDLSSGGTLDIDAITLTQDTVVQSDPWTAVIGSGGTVSQVVKVDSSRAHDSDGVLQFSTTGSAESGMQHSINTTPAVGSIYSGTVWVRSSTGTPISGRFVLSTVGGTLESASTSFTATSDWQMVSLQLPIANNGHTQLVTQVLLTTAGVTLDVDDVVVQEYDWAVFGVTASQTQVNDADEAQSGSGYLRISKTSNDDGGVQIDTAGNLSAGTSQTMTMYVRSTTGANVAGHMTLSGVGGSVQDSASTTFTASTNWTKVSVTVAISNPDQTALRSMVFVDSMNAGLEIDSVNVAEEPLGQPDGVTTPLLHPETGYVYLWDDAFGIPGAHLWSMTAQVAIINGRPALGLGATVYFDPTKASGVMTGTDWVKGDLVANISTVEPCFQFGFDATDTNARVAIDGGVLSTSLFQLSFAPRGCTVGDYVIAPGSVFAFDATLGDASLHFDLETGRDDNGLPTFYTDMRVQNLKLAGTTYNDMELIIDISAAGSEVSFNGDFTLPMGSMVGNFELTVNSDLLHMAGSVTLSDWSMVGGSFDVNSFNYNMSMDIPFGSGSCANFSAGTSGNMSMGSKSYIFDGNMTFECGELTVFHMHFDYMKKSVSYDFYLDYNSSNHVLSGGLAFKFERSTSWKYLSHRYRRHPKFEIKLDFSMDFDNPGNGKLSFYGFISVSGGEGSLSCTLNANGDDSCSLYVKIKVLGTHVYRGSW
jgi:hypothetical protein